MTLKEAKKILKKEGFCLVKVSKGFEFSELPVWEKQEVVEAKRVVNENGFATSMNTNEWTDRKERLKKEYEKNTKAPGPGEEQPKEGNPALKEAASQFNDALLDEQAKKIARLKKIIHKKNLKIEEFRKESSRHLRGKIKMFGENLDLSQELCDKNEELRLTKIREKNLAELGLKYVGENEKLKKELADKVVDKIDAQALKSAESALVEKDEVIETLDKELAEAKHELSSLKRPFRPDSTEAVVLFASAYAKAEMKHLPCTNWKNDGKEVSATYILENGKKSKIALDFTGDEIIFSRTDPDKPRKDSLYSYKDKQLAEEVELDEILECVRKALEDGHTVSIDYDKAEEGGDQSATIVQCDNGIILSKEEAEIIERCTKNGTELHYSEKDGFTYTNVFDEEMPIRCLRGMFHVFTDEEIENMKK